MKNVILSLTLILVSSSLFAQLSPIALNIPMRDGKFLAADFYSNDSSQQKPTILIMTPYNKYFYTLSGLPFGIKYDLTKSNYNFVVVDWRGRFGSLNAFSVNGDNGEDGYDVVEWIATQTWSDGKIGTWGPSALGNIQFDLAKEHPPHLTCCVPEVAAPMLQYKNYFPGGVLETSTFKTLNEKLFKGSYDLVIQNPYYNLLWQIVEESSTYPDEIEVPMLLIGGWFDHNIVQDLELVDTLSKVSNAAVKDKHKILIGPWVHGGTGQASLGTSFQGDLSFPEAEKWNDSLSLLFFDFYLRNVSNGWESRKKYTYFNMGKRDWKYTDVWPPASTKDYILYLSNKKELLEVQSTGKNYTYTYNPNDPSPTIGGKTLSDDLDQGPYDQSDSVESRNDVVIFTSEALTSNLSVKGKIKVKLFVSSDQKDTDFAVRLTEVYPDGKSIMLLDGIQRMRYRDGYTKNDTASMQPGTIYPITIELDDICNTFLTGNKIRLIVSSSNYPRFNRNMNTGGDMYPNDNPDTLVNPQVAINAIHTGMSFTSQLILPVDTLESAQITTTSLENTIQVYPNPTSDEIKIEGAPKDCTFKIYDLSGKLLVETNQANITLKNYNSGTYILHISNSTTTTIKKIILN